MSDPLYDIGPAWLADWDLTVQLDDVVAHLQDERLDALTAALAGLAGVDQAIHEDREVWHVRGTRVDHAACAAVVEAWLAAGED